MMEKSNRRNSWWVEQDSLTVQREFKRVGDSVSPALRIDEGTPECHISEERAIHFWICQLGWNRGRYALVPMSDSGIRRRDGGFFICTNNFHTPDNSGLQINVSLVTNI